jgi:hypothetical protein
MDSCREVDLRVIILNEMRKSVGTQGRKATEGVKVWSAQRPLRAHLRKPWGTTM